jgi:hypothetical protein
MQSEKSGDYNDHDHYANDVENIHVPLRLRFWLRCAGAGAKTRSVLSRRGPGPSALG